MGDSVGICCQFRPFIWCKRFKNTETQQSYTKCNQKTWIKPLSICSSLKPVWCAQFNFAYAWHALSRSSWAPQSLANLICESMGFSHCNNKSLWHANGYTSQQHLRAASIPPRKAQGLLPEQLKQYSTHKVKSFKTRRKFNIWIINVERLLNCWDSASCNLWIFVQ